ncbi:MAG: ATP-binding cassette domain-containing protein [Pyrinomonadaceae bacterium]
MKSPALSFENVSITYPNGTRAAHEVSFRVEEGECLALVGESGSGKTTLVRAALGLLPANTNVSGSIRVGETEIVGAAFQILRGLRGLVAGFVPQDPFAACNPLARIYDHVAEAWRVHDMRPPARAITNSLEKLGIENASAAAQSYPHQWSGGMLQRAGIAAAAAHQPRLIIADEPTSALDADRADSILLAIRATKAAILLVSHDINLVARHADRIAVCYLGHIVEIEDAATLLQRPKHPYTTKLLNAFPRAGEHLLPPQEGKQRLLAQPSKSLKNVPEESFDAQVYSDSVVVEARDVSRVYGRGKEAVHAIVKANLRVRRGEIVGIHGASGCGKSTLLRVLGTIEPPSRGTINLDGESVVRDKRFLSRRAWSGFVMPIFQDPVGSLDRRWSIWRTITEPLMASHRKFRPSRIERREIARARMAQVDLTNVDLDARPGELSVGQCQRVSIARALVAEPRLIVADEPTSALDRAIAAKVLRLLAAAAEEGTAIVIVSHDEAILNVLCHRVLKMSGGVLEEG